MSTVLGGTHEGFAATQEARREPLSIGTPNAGQLIGGKLFRETRYMVMVPARAKSQVHWALPALLSVLDRASRIVARKHPGSVLEVGEMSRREGGPAALHLSHQNGRDADIAFYVLDQKGDPVRLPAYTRFDGSGEGKDDPSLRFDDDRNWAFVRAILEDPHNEVRQIFISAPLRARLLAYAAAIKAPRALRVKAAKVMMQPGNALPHDDHFHIRISCPVEQLDLGCADLPIWRGPGSPDEYGIGAWARLWWRSQYDALNALPPAGWGPVSRLWSADLGVCKRADLSCIVRTDTLTCSEADRPGEPEPCTVGPIPLALAKSPSHPSSRLPDAGASLPWGDAIPRDVWSLLGLPWSDTAHESLFSHSSRRPNDGLSFLVPALAEFSDINPRCDAGMGLQRLPFELAAAGSFGGLLPWIGAGDVTRWCVPAAPLPATAALGPIDRTGGRFEIE